MFGLCVGIFLVEGGLRLVYLPAPLTLANFATARIGQQVSSLAMSYDPLLGYVPKADDKEADYNQGPWGVRLNRIDDAVESFPGLPSRGILATGDSFTFGAEVKADESWPAYLETLVGMPVVNAGVSGYGIDQAILRALQMVDVVRPRLIIVSFIPNNVGRNEMSINGGLAKPYFDIESDGLILKGVPVPRYSPSKQYVGRVRAILGYSYAVYWTADRLGLRDKWLVGNYETRIVHPRGVAVSCRLWGYLADKLAGSGIRVVALAQYAGIQVSGQDGSRADNKVEYVLDCARRAGFVAVDSYGELRRRYESDEKSFWANWVREPHDEGRAWNTGHMSPQGNRLTAEIIGQSLTAAGLVP